MGEFRDDPRLVEAHVRTLTDRSPDDGDRLADALFVRCWPAGADDRLDPIAVEWVRRWTPRTLIAARLDCSCSNGRCAICN
jgi:hypothetical protein